MSEKCKFIVSGPIDRKFSFPFSRKGWYEALKKLKSRVPNDASSAQIEVQCGKTGTLDNSIRLGECFGVRGDPPRCSLADDFVTWMKLSEKELAGVRRRKR